MEFILCTFLMQHLVCKLNALIYACNLIFHYSFTNLFFCFAGYKTRMFPSLTHLILKDNRIAEVRYLCHELGSEFNSLHLLQFLIFWFQTQWFKTAIFLFSMFQWSVINELDKLQKLESFDCRSNPLMDSEKNVETVKQLIIAKIGQLKFLNKSQVYFCVPLAILRKHIQ